LFGGEPGDVGELVFADGRGTIDDRGLVHRGDVGGTVPVRVVDLVVRAAEDVQQAHQPDVDANLFTGLADRRLGRRLADLNGTAEHAPSVVMTSVADEQQPPGLVNGKHRDRREQKQVVSDGRPQPRDMRRDAHLGTVPGSEHAQARELVNGIQGRGRGLGWYEGGADSVPRGRRAQCQGRFQPVTSITCGLR
jgi:hypothetical protein